GMGGLGVHAGSLARVCVTKCKEWWGGVAAPPVRAGPGFCRCPLSGPSRVGGAGEALGPDAAIHPGLAVHVVDRALGTEAVAAGTEIGLFGCGLAGTDGQSRVLLSGARLDPRVLSASGEAHV